ncbi:putative oxidoreductase protein [Thioalkalivibrio nitratireducens DSM 14787]|uniref:Oxidoreductase protein n=1 Tax=Thioalkalivibrio nitratireducens (strain DSM 14787 / UNIQEM 213 / ALEN2) TaxID=1255043 RepID=L0E1V0_THIND|nr:putative oxidoreductase protein [Thioalkalivibrio nitratireducens DSM 14787]
MIGMGTWITFNVGPAPELRAARTEVLRTFLARGGGVLDSSPMYGSAEVVIGHALERIGDPGGLFSATKVWTRRAGQGPEQVARSRSLWGLERFDLLQVHNLVAWPEHLRTLQDERERGRVRYLGVTTSHGRRHDELARILRNEPIDFVQLTYNILDRESEQRLLPLAADRGIAVITNRPFRQKALITRFEHHPLPDWAGEIACVNWPQFLLKFIVSHPAVTCAIPATTRVDHVEHNMGAMSGPMPDAAMRREMAAYVRGL